jgi:histidine ammonia-lyase
LLCAAQGLDWLAPLRPGAGAAQAQALVRSVVPPLTADRPLSDDIEALAALVLRGEFRSLVQP